MDRERIKKQIHNIKMNKAMINELIEQRISELESQLASKQPELRHADYGISIGSNESYIVIDDDVYWLIEKCGKSGLSINTPAVKNGYIGNLADDLAAMAEDVEEIHLFAGSRLFCIKNVYYPDDIGFQVIIGDRAIYSLDELQKIHKQIGARIATAHRKAKGESNE